MEKKSVILNRAKAKEANEINNGLFGMFYLWNEQADQRMVRAFGVLLEVTRIEMKILIHSFDKFPQTVEYPENDLVFRFFVDGENGSDRYILQVEENKPH